VIDWLRRARSAALQTFPSCAWPSVAGSTRGAAMRSRALAWSEGEGRGGLASGSGWRVSRVHRVLALIQQCIDKTHRHGVWRSSSDFLYRSSPRARGKLARGSEKSKSVKRVRRVKRGVRRATRIRTTRVISTQQLPSRAHGRASAQGDHARRVRGTCVQAERALREVPDVRAGGLPRVRRPPLQTRRRVVAVPALLRRRAGAAIYRGRVSRLVWRRVAQAAVRARGTCAAARNWSGGGGCANFRGGG